MQTIAEMALSAYDTYSTYQTVSSPNASSAEKAGAVALFSLGLVGPGGGYKAIGGKADDAYNILKGAGRVGDNAKISSKYNWGNANTLSNHFQGHGQDFGAKDTGDYAKKAQDFYKQYGKQGLDVKIDHSSGDVLMYESKTNTFGVYSRGGDTKSFFKPDSAKNGGRTGQQYFNDQRGRRAIQ